MSANRHFICFVTAVCVPLKQDFTAFTHVRTSSRLLNTWPHIRSTSITSFRRLVSLRLQKHNPLNSYEERKTQFCNSLIIRRPYLVTILQDNALVPIKFPWRYQKVFLLVQVLPDSVSNLQTFRWSEWYQHAYRRLRCKDLQKTSTESARTATLLTSASWTSSSGSGCYGNRSN